MTEYEWPEELDVYQHELSPATVSMLSPDTLQALERIRDYNHRQRELSRIRFAPKPQHSIISRFIQWLTGKTPN